MVEYTLNCLNVKDKIYNYFKDIGYEPSMNSRDCILTFMLNKSETTHDYTYSDSEQSDYTASNYTEYSISSFTTDSYSYSCYSESSESVKNNGNIIPMNDKEIDYPVNQVTKKLNEKEKDLPIVKPKKIKRRTKLMNKIKSHFK